MEWSIFVCLLVCLARFCEGGALRCPPGVSDSSCTEEKSEVGTQNSYSAEVQCLAGTEWESNCHNCRCSSSGVAECRKMNKCDKGTFAEPTLCKPNTTFQRECSTCMCLDNGLGLCTLQHCRRFDDIKGTLELSEESSSEKESSKQLDTPVVVTPGENDSNEVNFIEIKYMLKLSTICKPSTEFMKECNPCKCAADGLSYTCTRNECMEVDKVDKEVEVFMESKGADHIERHTVCRARATFNISCNSCRCNALGTDYACTNKLCPLPPDVEVFGPQDQKQATPYTGDDDLEVIKA